MESLPRLRVLAELAKRGSFSAAAEALNYTQPAVSKQIAALERETGTQLVVRGVRPVRFTDAGEALARHAQTVFEQLAAASAELEAIAALQAGRLRLGTFSSAGATLVVQALAEFHDQHPGVEVTIVEASPEPLAQAVRAGELDLVVVYDYPMIGQTLDDGLNAHHLLDDPADLLVHDGHRLANRKTATFADLRDERWLFPILGPDVPPQKLLTANCAAAGYEPNIAFQINDCEMTQALVAAGMGISLLPRLAIHPIHPGVRVIPLKGTHVRRVLALRLSEAHTPASDAFLTLLGKYAAAYPHLAAPARA
jgi:DNA-binding transcriptional LysR family regulator